MLSGEAVSSEGQKSQGGEGEHVFSIGVLPVCFCLAVTAAVCAMGNWAAGQHPVLTFFFFKGLFLSPTIHAMLEVHILQRRVLREREARTLFSLVVSFQDVATTDYTTCKYQFSFNFNCVWKSLLGSCW